MNQLDINIENEVWPRFPYACSYCGECPCACKLKKVQKRVSIKIDEKKHPKNIALTQEMFNKIYPAKGRTLEHAGIHLAEEVGELSEAVLRFRGHHDDADLAQINLEASDLVSCYMGVLNSANIDFSKELVSKFVSGCHVCKKTPCVCEYNSVLNFKS